MTLRNVDANGKPYTSIGKFEWAQEVVQRGGLSELTTTQSWVASAMFQFADRDGGSMHPGIKRLMAVTGLQRRAVEKALDAILAAGLMVLDRKTVPAQRKANVYRLALPPDHLRVAFEWNDRAQAADWISGKKARGEGTSRSRKGNAANFSGNDVLRMDSKEEAANDVHRMDAKTEQGPSEVTLDVHRMDASRGSPDGPLLGHIPGHLPPGQERATPNADVEVPADTAKITDSAGNARPKSNPDAWIPRNTSTPLSAPSETPPSSSPPQVTPETLPSAADTFPAEPFTDSAAEPATEEPEHIEPAPPPSDDDEPAYVEPDWDAVEHDLAHRDNSAEHCARCSRWGKCFEHRSADRPRWTPREEVA